MTARILMVDDEPDAQDLFRQNFRREIRKGVYAFEFALSGEAALEVLKGQTPPEVLLATSAVIAAVITLVVMRPGARTL